MMMIGRTLSSGRRAPTTKNKKGNNRTLWPRSWRRQKANATDQTQPNNKELCTSHVTVTFLVTTCRPLFRALIQAPVF